MTTQEIVDYYTNLLILQYHDKPKAKATVDAVVNPIIMDQLPIDVQNAYGLETAVGAQLDVIGNIVGITRNGVTFSGPVTLTDSDFRQLIKFAIITNNSGSSLYDIQQILNVFFPGDFLVFDYANMFMSYFFSTAIGTQQLAEMILIQGLLPKPMGVGVGSVIYAPYVSGFFGMITYDVAAFPAWDITTTYSYGQVVQDGGSYWQSIVDSNLGNNPAVGVFWKYYTGYNVNGFNTYSSYNLTWTWLRYSYAIVVP
jgi:hypothetical protein